MSGAPAVPTPDLAALRPLLWTCAAFAGGVLLHADRVPRWAVSSRQAIRSNAMAAAQGGTRSACSNTPPPNAAQVQSSG